MQLDGASAIVTGGASGLGAAVARRLAALGVKVVVADLSDGKGVDVAEEIGGAFAHVDVTSVEDVIAATELAKTLGPVSNPIEREYRSSEPSAIPAIRNFFDAYVISRKLRSIIDQRKFTELVDKPMLTCYCATDRRVQPELKRAAC